MAKRQRSRQPYEYKKIIKDSGSEDEGEEVELFVKNKSPTKERKEIPTINKEIEEGDTLQSLAIRYHCTIEELKRLNNIHKENEIFALRIIKVPRTLTMALAGVHISGSSSPGKDPGPSKPIEADILHSVLNTTFERDLEYDKLKEVKDIIFNTSIKKSEPQNREEEMEDSVMLDEEEILLLPHRERTVGDPILSKLSFNGADCDIPWVVLIILIVIGVVAIPFYYVFYVVEHLEEYHHNNTYTNSNDVS